MKKLLSFTLVLTIVLSFCAVSVGVNAASARPTPIWDNFADIVVPDGAGRGALELTSSVDLKEVGAKFVAVEGNPVVWDPNQGDMKAVNGDLPDIVTGKESIGIGKAMEGTWGGSPAAVTSFSYEGNFTGMGMRITFSVNDDVYREAFAKAYPDADFKWGQWDCLQNGFFEENLKFYAGTSADDLELIETYPGGWTGGSVTGGTYITAVSREFPAGTTYVKVAIENVLNWRSSIGSIRLDDIYELVDYRETLKNFNDDFSTFGDKWIGKVHTNVGNPGTSNNVFGLPNQLWWDQNAGGWIGSLTYEGEFDGNMLEAFFSLDSFVVNSGMAQTYPDVDGLYDRYDLLYDYLLKDRLTVYAGPTLGSMKAVPVNYVIGALSSPAEGQSIACGIVVETLPENSKYVKVEVAGQFPNRIDESTGESTTTPAWALRWLGINVKSDKSSLTDGTYRVNELEQTGDRIKSIKRVGDTIVDFTIASAANVEGTAFVATYENVGGVRKLLNVKPVKVTAADYSNGSATIKVDLSVDSNATFVKVIFVNPDNMMPITDAYSENF